MTTEQPKGRNPFLVAFEACFPVFSALAAILAVRLFLLFAIVGAFILAQSAMLDQTNHGMYVLAVYCAFTILPLVYLDIYGKRSLNGSGG